MNRYYQWFCQISYKCSTGENSHSTTVGILGMLSSYSWDSKVVIALAAFALNFGEVQLITQLYTTNSLATSIAMLKHVPETQNQEDILGLHHRYGIISNIISFVFIFVPATYCTFSNFISCFISLNCILILPLK